MRIRVLRRVYLPVFLLAAALTSAARDADRAETAFQAGNRLFDKGQFADAVDMYTRALEQDPRSAKAYYNRALASEMVDRMAAIRDWKEFLELAQNNPAWKAMAPQVRERVETLEKMPALPDSLQPSAYLPKAGDYYKEVAQGSEGLQFYEFPVKVFVGSVPRGWERATRTALESWIRVFPLEEVASREGADIVLNWGASTKESQRAGRESDVVQVEKKDNGAVVKRTKTAFITLDSSHRWSEEQKRATILHELGHALGIHGHSDRAGDVMFGTIQESLTEMVGQKAMTAPPRYSPPPSNASPSLPQKPSQRDVNTLIRLYNTPGPLPRAS
jgi:predicted Zn-dependent protease